MSSLWLQNATGIRLKSFQIGNSRNISRNSSLSDPIQEDGETGTGSSILSTSSGQANKTRTRVFPPFVGMPDSSFRSTYHKYWKTNCSLLFEHNMTEIEATSKLLDQSRVGNLLSVPSDRDFVRYTSNCSLFTNHRNYPMKPLPREEEEYPIAYIITVHMNVAQVERLLRAVYQPQNIYCIHPDSKSPPAFQEAIKGLDSCFPNVFISSKVENVLYAGFSRLQADINRMNDLLEKSVQWRYVINLCGEDFPLRTNLEIVQQLKTGRDHNFIGYDPITYSKKLRTAYHHVSGRRHPVRTNKTKSNPPIGFVLYNGLAYYAATRKFVDYVVHDAGAKALLEWSKDTYSPDELYWATLQARPGVPGGFTDAPLPNRNIRYIQWQYTIGPPCMDQYIRQVCVFGMRSLKHLLSQTSAFANKFHYSFDPVVLQCLEEMLDYRERYPE